MNHPTLFDDEIADIVQAASANVPDPDTISRTNEPGRNTIDSTSTSTSTDDDIDQEEFEVVVIRSARRKRSVGAQLRGNVLQVTVPTWMSRLETEKWVANMSARYRRKMATDRIDLKDRAMTLARRYDLSFPREIRWVDDMTTRWGSCTPSTGTIRLSSRLGKFPNWVIDYVVIHELAHLDVGDHSPSFWRLVHRYPKAERAIGYLIAKSGDEELDE